MGSFPQSYFPIAASSSLHFFRQLPTSTPYFSSDSRYSANSSRKRLHFFSSLRSRSSISLSLSPESAARLICEFFWSWTENSRQILAVLTISLFLSPEQRVFLMTSSSNRTISLWIFCEQERYTFSTPPMNKNICSFIYLMCSSRRRMRAITSVRPLLFSVGSIDAIYYIIIRQALRPTVDFIIRPQHRIAPFKLYQLSYMITTLRLLFPFSVRVRYAPSPTGFMHVGGLRTALFNYLFARKLKGTFILRIEDTDKSREVEGSIDNIFDALSWLQAEPDESIRKGGEYGPYIQSERMPIYKAVEKQLLKSNMAYPCFCKEKPKEGEEGYRYDGRCRGLGLSEIKERILGKEEYAVRIKSDLIVKPASFLDEVFGELEFKELDDFVIVRSNGWPTFHLASVVDDWKMGVTHVLRGEEWLTNTNKHIYLYQLLGAPIPKFAHLPLIKDMNGKKLAKRDPSSAVKNFQTGKYEVEAVKCFLAQMGLNRAHQPEQQAEKASKKSGEAKGEKGAGKGKGKGKEGKAVRKQEDNLKLMGQSEMIEEFDISRITKVPVKFDIKQLDFLNRLSLKKRWKVAQLIDSEMQYFISKTHELIPSSQRFDKAYLIRFIGSVIDRFSFITDIPLYKYYFEDPDFSTPKCREDIQAIFGKEAVLEKEGDQFRIRRYDPLLYEKNKKILHSLRMLIEHIIEPSGYCQLEIAKKISDFLYQSPQLKNEDVFHMLRFVIMGRKSGPNITLACEILGRQEVLRRLAAFSHL